MTLLKYLEIESLDNDWSGRIYIKVIRENKINFITNQYPKIGITATNYKDREIGEVKWSKLKMECNRIKIKQIHNKIPNVDSLKIYD